MLVITFLYSHALSSRLLHRTLLPYYNYKQLTKTLQSQLVAQFSSKAHTIATIIARVIIII